MHRRTDPACVKHHRPRGPISQWWYDRGRGKSCTQCMEVKRGNLTDWNHTMDEGP